MQHANRAHAQWSASSTAANWACAGRLALIEATTDPDAPERTSEAADWGTACHQISERCLRSGQDAADFIGTTEKGKKYSFEVDDEMADTAQRYIDYVRGVFGPEDWVPGEKCDECRGSGVEKDCPTDSTPCGYCGGTGDQFGHLNSMHIEQRFSLASLNPPFEAGGTADAVIYNPAAKMLEVVDLKGGRGVVVEAKGNPQLRTYALGAMLANPGLAVETVKVTIVQPRAGHPDGRIRSETFHVIDLLEWTSDLLLAMDRAKRAADRKADLPDAAWAASFLVAGDHCKFCPCAGFCPALEQKALDTAGLHFDDLDQPVISPSNAPALQSPERLAQLLDAADMIGDWMNAVRAYAHEQAEAGATIPNYILVEKEGREKWVEGVEADLKTSLLSVLTEDKFINPGKLRTPKQVRDALKKAKADAALITAVSALSSTPKTGTNLVRSSKTTRSAATPSVNKHFDILD